MPLGRSGLSDRGNPEGQGSEAYERKEMGFPKEWEGIRKEEGKRKTRRGFKVVNMGHSRKKQESKSRNPKGVT